MDPITDAPPEPEADATDPEDTGFGETETGAVQAVPPPQEPIDAEPPAQTEREAERDPPPGIEADAHEAPWGEAASRVEPEPEPADADDAPDPDDSFVGIAPTDRRNPHNGQIERTFYDPRSGKPLAAFVIAPERGASRAFGSEASPFSAGLQPALYVRPAGSDGSELFIRAARPGPGGRYPPAVPPPPPRPRRGSAAPRLRSLNRVDLEKRVMPVTYRGGLDPATHEAANAALDGGVRLLDAQIGTGRLTAQEADALRALKSFAIAPGRSGQDRGVFTYGAADLGDPSPWWVASCIIHDGVHARRWRQGTNYVDELVPSLVQEAYLRRMGQKERADWVRKFRVEPAMQLERLQQPHH